MQSRLTHSIGLDTGTAAAPAVSLRYSAKPTSGPQSHELMGKKDFRVRCDVYVYMLSTTTQTTVVPVPLLENAREKKENKSSVSMVQAILN